VPQQILSRHFQFNQDFYGKSRRINKYEESITIDEYTVEFLKYTPLPKTISEA